MAHEQPAGEEVLLLLSDGVRTADDGSWMAKTDDLLNLYSWGEFDHGNLSCPFLDEHCARRQDVIRIIDVHCYSSPSLHVLAEAPKVRHPRFVSEPRALRGRIGIPEKDHRVDLARRSELVHSRQESYLILHRKRWLSIPSRDPFDDRKEGCHL